MSHGPRAICDRCGFEFWLDQLRKEWTGLMVCSSCWDPRHPQEFVRGVRDSQGVRPNMRPEPDDVFISVNPPGWGPTILTDPVISGPRAVGATLTASPGTWANNPTAFTYQWSVEGVTVSGQTGQTYVVAASDLDTVSCAVTATNDAGGTGIADGATIVTYSEAVLQLLSESVTDISNSYWGNTNITVSDGYTDPTGGIVAEQALETTANGSHEWALEQAANRYDLSDGVTYCMEAVVKSIGARWLALKVFDSSFGQAAIRFFDVSTGVVGVSDGGYGSAFGSQSLTIDAMGNGYYRCRLIWTMTSTEADCFYYWGIASADGTSSYVGDVAKGLGVYSASLYQVL